MCQGTSGLARVGDVLRAQGGGGQAREAGSGCFMTRRNRVVVHACVASRVDHRIGCYSLPIKKEEFQRKYERRCTQNTQMLWCGAQFMGHLGPSVCFACIAFLSVLKFLLAYGVRHPSRVGRRSRQKIDTRSRSNAGRTCSSVVVAITPPERAAIP